MTRTRTRRLKTLFGASNVVCADNDQDKTFGFKRAIELAKKAEAEKITGLLQPTFCNLIRRVLQAQPAHKTRLSLLQRWPMPHRISGLLRPSQRRFCILTILHARSERWTI